MKRSGDPVEAILVVWEYYWDFCEQHPDYIALLFRESFDANSPRIKGLVIATDYALSLTRAYIRHAQEAGKIREFDPDSHLHWALMTPMSFFALPGTRTNLWQGTRSKASAREAKAAFLEAARYFLEQA